MSEEEKQSILASLEKGSAELSAALEDVTEVHPARHARQIEEIRAARAG